MSKGMLLGQLHSRPHPDQVLSFLGRVVLNRRPATGSLQIEASCSGDENAAIEAEIRFWRFNP